MTFSLSPQYNFDIGSGAKGLIRVDIQSRGETYLTGDNSDNLKQEPFTLINARVGVSFADSKYGVYLWGRNLTNQTYPLFGQEILNIALLPNLPRLVGVEFRAGLYGK